LDESIGLVVPDPERHMPVERRADEELKGTVAGAVIGLPIGGLAGLAAVMLLVPGAGAVALAGAVGGALWGAYIGGMAGFVARVRNDPDEDLWYEIPLRSGQILVIAHAKELAHEAHDVMHRHNVRCFVGETCPASEPLRPVAAP
jgi:hypothetical protein